MINNNCIQWMAQRDNVVWESSFFLSNWPTYVTAHQFNCRPKSKQACSILYVQAIYVQQKNSVLLREFPRKTAHYWYIPAFQPKLTVVNLTFVINSVKGTSNVTYSRQWKSMYNGFSEYISQPSSYPSTNILTVDQNKLLILRSSFKSISSQINTTTQIHIKIQWMLW